MSGKLYSETSPGIVDTEVFRNYIKAFEENVPQDFQVYHKTAKTDSWFRITAVKVGDGVASKFGRYYTSKKSGKGTGCSARPLKTSRRTCTGWQLGIRYKYKTILWSEGMYRLFNMKKGRHVVPGVYLNYSKEQDLPIAQKIVDAIERKIPSV
jgi:hypothetical protein